jgi:hypothetical protein
MRGRSRNSRTGRGTGWEGCEIFIQESPDRSRENNQKRHKRKRFITKELYKDALGWGFILWFIGYLLGIMLFTVVPISVIGWIIMPIGTIITIWVLLKKIKADSFQYYALLAIIWTIIAVVFDYFFLVKVFKPADGYYKLDVYLYYTLTFVLPLIVGWRKTNQR